MENEEQKQHLPVPEQEQETRPPSLPEPWQRFMEAIRKQAGQTRQKKDT
ncbi:hypothetical protein ACAF76_011305 [Brevibacillus sp. TJ4]